MAIPARIKSLASDVRNKIYGKDVRESIAKGMEISGEISEESNNISKSTALRQSNIEKRYDVAVAAHTEDSEVMDARVNADASITYTNIKQRMDNEHEDTARKINDIYLNIKDYGAIGDGITNDFPALLNILEAVKKLGGGTVYFPRPEKYYLMNPTGYFERHRVIDLSNEINYLRLTGDDSKIKLSGGLSFSSFIRAYNKNLVFKMDRLHFDGNATKNPHNTGTTGNPRENAQRLIEVYCKEGHFEQNEFHDFHGVNIIIMDRHVDIDVNTPSVCRFLTNKITKFGYDSSNSIHDSSAFYSHADYAALDSNHTVISKDNNFEANHNAIYSNAYSAQELGGENILSTGNITNGFYIGTIIAHQFRNKSVIVEQNTFNNCVQGTSMWSYKNEAPILSQDIEGLRNVSIKDNTINISPEYWKRKAVYSSHFFDREGYVTHDYAGIMTTGNIYRNIRNLSIKNNMIVFDITNAPISLSYNPIQIAEFSLSNPNTSLTFENIEIEDNTLINALSTPIVVEGRKIYRLSIRNNKFLGFCKNSESGKRGVRVRNKTENDILKDVDVSNNEFIERKEEIGIIIEISAYGAENIKIKDNDYDVNVTNGHYMFSNIVNKLTLNEAVNKDFDSDFVQIKSAILKNIMFRTPLRTINENRKSVFFVNRPTELNKTAFINDEIQPKNNAIAGYASFICTTAGTPGNWVGLGKIN